MKDWIATLVRIVTGILFVTFSLGKFVDHTQESADFDRYGIPFPEVTTYLVGTLEMVCGVLLLLGLLTRPAALLLAAQPGRRDRHRGPGRRRYVPPRGRARDVGGDGVPGVGGRRPARARS